MPAVRKDAILISYRRDNTASFAARIFETLSAHFGKDRVFWDLDSIPVGYQFDIYLEKRFRDAAVALVLIGDRWEGILDDRSPRLTDPQDWVRREVSVALKMRVPIIPVLVGNRHMPNITVLPTEMKGLASWQAIRVDPGIDFAHHVLRLIAGIESLLSEQGHIDSNTLAVSGTMALLANRQRPDVTVGTIADEGELRELYEIDAAAYGRNSISFETFLRWWKAHRTGTYAIKSEATVLGAVGIWPIHQDWFQSFLAGDVREADLGENELLSIYNGNQVIWYISGIVLLPSRRGSTLAGYLVQETICQWSIDHQVAYPVQVFALAYSKMGEQLLKKFGFCLASTGTNLPDGCPVYQRQISRIEIKQLLIGVST